MSLVPFFEEIHIENTNSCGYRCVMCPRDLHTRKIGFMTPEDFSVILDRINLFKGLFHLHGFGEPLLDRKLSLKVELLKKKFPSASTLIFSTLGVKLKENCFQKLAEAGLDDLVISFYGFSKESYQKIHGFDGFDLAKKNLQLLSNVMKLPGHFIRAYIKIPAETFSSTLPIASSSDKKAFCLWAEDLGFEIREWSYVHNYGDGRNYNTPKEDKICPVIQGKRKNILNITWNLDVIPCCYDFNATIRFGNLREATLEKIFSSKQYFDFVLAHKLNNLSRYSPCLNCEKNDYE
jgi:radical SAM protein with 4Fe4S-binding SPASM domain